jgi:hypothetical protein
MQLKRVGTYQFPPDGVSRGGSRYTERVSVIESSDVGTKLANYGGYGQKARAIQLDDVGKYHVHRAWPNGGCPSWTIWSEMPKFWGAPL